MVVDLKTCPKETALNHSNLRLGLQRHLSYAFRDGVSGCRIASCILRRVLVVDPVAIALGRTTYNMRVK